MATIEHGSSRLDPGSSRLDPGSSRLDPGSSRKAPRQRAVPVPRWLNVVFGSWLLVSAFALPHSPASITNTIVVGALIAAAALWGMSSSAGRLSNSLLAVWLFLSTLLLDHVTTLTAAHNAVLAALVFAVSLIPARGVMTTDRSPDASLET